jgi:hypothetical protein
VNRLDALYDLGGLHSRGERKLLDETFENEILERLLIGPGELPDHVVSVENCSFIKCKVKGEFRIAPGVKLQNVIFEDVISPDLMTINTQAVLDRVVVKGGAKTKGLWVKPAIIEDRDVSNEFSEWVRRSSNAVDWMLDFSGYEGGEIEVVGLPLNKIKWNTDRHIVINLDWSKTEVWQRLALPITGFFRLRMKRLQTFGVNSGVYSLPDISSKLYASAREELSKIISSGFDVRG